MVELLILIVVYLFFFRTISLIIMMGFLFTICIVLLNILIAQVSNTYQIVQQDVQRYFQLHRTLIVTRAEVNTLCFCMVIFFWVKLNKKNNAVSSRSNITTKVFRMIRKYHIKYMFYCTFIKKNDILLRSEILMKHVFLNY